MSVNWEKLRNEQFPILKNLTYIMAGSASPLNMDAYRKGISYFEDMLYFGDIHYENFCEEIEKTRKNVAEYINSEPDEIAFLTNTSSGMNIIARFLEKGEFLYPSIEFPASIHIFKRLKFSSKRVEDTSHSYLIDNFKQNISDETKYIIHSHVQSLTGFRQNLEKLGVFCREHNLLSIINATQSFCSFDIDTKNHNLDILVANPLKWGACGYGVGILYMNQELLNKKEIPFSSWLSVANPFYLNNENVEVINKVKYMDGFGGCANFPALLSFSGTLNLIKTQIGRGKISDGIKRIQERIIYLTNIFINKIKSYNFKIITPLEPEFRSGIITIEHQKAEKIYNILLKNKIYVTLKRYPDFHEQTLLRFAFHYYNNEEDINRVINVLESHGI
ncbi:MAG: aminotransferase class V-fold PLP-dependent enzyme [Candidatus Thorarchaeota archaeon]